jgi:hypothetical protein
VEYGRPALKGRTVQQLFAQLGTGGIWRLGADQSTTFVTTADLSFQNGGQGSVSVPKGEYSIWARRGAHGDWVLLFNTQSGQHGTRYNAEHVLVAVPLRRGPSGEKVELVTIAALFVILLARRQPPIWVIAYAWHPLVILEIAGSGHVRKDRGVPASLARRRPGATVVSLTFLEVRKGETETGAYASDFGPGPFPFDYVWFTPRVDDLDPCEKFEKQLEGLRKEDEGVND